MIPIFIPRFSIYVEYFWTKYIFRPYPRLPPLKSRKIFFIYFCGYQILLQIDYYKCDSSWQIMIFLRESDLRILEYLWRYIVQSFFFELSSGVFL